MTVLNKGIFNIFDFDGNEKLGFIFSFSLLFFSFSSLFFKVGFLHAL